jgi:hypothetical protein
VNNNSPDCGIKDGHGIEHLSKMIREMEESFFWCSTQIYKMGGREKSHSLFLTVFAIQSCLVHTASNLHEAYYVGKTNANPKVHKNSCRQFSNLL